MENKETPRTKAAAVMKETSLMTSQKQTLILLSSQKAVVRVHLTTMD